MSRPASGGVVLAMIAGTAACSEPNQAPFSCGSTPSQAVDVGESISFMPCFTDPDADPLTISAEVPHHLNPYVAASVAGEIVTIPRQERARPAAAHHNRHHPDPGEPFFGVCGESETPEYNLANNCSKGLKVIFPESAAQGLRHSSTPPAASSFGCWTMGCSRQKAPNTRPE